MKKLFSIFIFILTLCTCFAQTSDERVSDINYLNNELPNLHYDLFYIISKSEFSDELDHLKSKVSSLTNLEFALSLQQILVKVGDPHTGIDYFPLIDKQNTYPLKLYWLKDGFYVLATHKNYEVILGQKLYAINGISIDEIIQRFATIIVKDNDAIIKHRLPNLIVFKDILDFLNITTSGENAFTFSKNNQLTEIKFLTNSEILDRKNIEQLIPNSIPLSLSNQRKLFWLKYIEEENVIYAQYNLCWGRELEEQYGSQEKAKQLPSFKEFSNKLTSLINGLQPSKLIFDLRFNPGGSSLQGTELIDRLLEIKRLKKKGNLFVIIGRRTFSSAVINAIEFKQKMNAILVGEETSGSPNHFGEVKTLILPHTNIQVKYSTKYFKLVDSDQKTIIPDIKLETSIDDFVAGYDPILDYIYKY